MIAAFEFMCSLYRNKYRVESTRYPGFDYTSPGKYFITMCTKNKIPYFGKIRDGKMMLSEAGITARNCWIEIPSHFPDICLDEFIIMPDHIHGIIIINPKSKSLSNPSVQTPNLGVSTDTGISETPNLGVSTDTGISETPKLGVSTDTGISETPKLGVSTDTGIAETPRLGVSAAEFSIKFRKTGNPFWKPNSIGSIINQFKRICKIKTKTNGLELIWQPRFHDRIIRSQTELNRIRNYIINNPGNYIKHRK